MVSPGLFWSPNWHRNFEHCVGYYCTNSMRFGLLERRGIHLLSDITVGRGNPFRMTVEISATFCWLAVSQKLCSYPPIQSLLLLVTEGIPRCWISQSQNFLQKLLRLSLIFAFWPKNDQNKSWWKWKSCRKSVALLSSCSKINLTIKILQKFFERE